MLKFRAAPFTLLLCALALSACESLGLSSDPTYSNPEKEKLYRNGSLLSDQGGSDFLGGKLNKDKDDGGVGLGVNGFLWRASLDTISFMPIASADPFGGIITTDWYSATNAPNERAKLNIFILDRDLRADGVRVSLFRQTRGVSGNWMDAPVNPTTATQLEETILTRARQLRMTQKETQDK